jgi:hypothetical protein
LRLFLPEFLRHFRITEFLRVNIYDVDAGAVFDFTLAQVVQIRLPMSVLLKIFGHGEAARNAIIGGVALNNCQPREFSPKHFLTRRFQPSIQHGSVNAAKIRVEFQVAVVKIDKTRTLTK